MQKENGRVGSRQTVLIRALGVDPGGRRSHPRNSDDESDGNAGQEHGNRSDYGVKHDAYDESRNERRRDESTYGLTFHGLNWSNPRATSLRHDSSAGSASASRL